MDEDLLVAACQGFEWKFTFMGETRRKTLRRKMLNALQRYEEAKAKKPGSKFATLDEAYDFINGVYQETGGPTPELRDAFRGYMEYKRAKTDDPDAAR